MDAFAYRNEHLHCEAVDLAELVARHGSPTYVYSSAHVLARLCELETALAPIRHQVCFAVKTNSNLGILGLLARAGAGFDIVSGGELARLRAVGADMHRVVFAGVGKSRDELAQALAAGIGMFNVESVPEAEALGRLATGLGRSADVALRVNPGLAAGAHRHISTGTATSKFGIPSLQVPETYARLGRIPGLRPVGLHCHIGSQILDPALHAAAATHLAGLVRQIRDAGGCVESVNLGGGIGIRYDDEAAPTAAEYAGAVLPPLAELGVSLLVEPGRFLIGNAGVLLTQVLYRKVTQHRTFIVVDAGMNDLVRPSLYDAHHEIRPVVARPGTPHEVVDVVGPICESADSMARDRLLPRLEAGDAIAIGSAGAYGFVMSSNYNSRARAAEVLVHGDAHAVVRRRETFEDLLRLEQDWRPGEHGL